MKIAAEDGYHRFVEPFMKKLEATANPTDMTPEEALEFYENIQADLLSDIETVIGGLKDDIEHGQGGSDDG